MSDGSINLVKLCVGANSVSDLVSYQKSRLSEAKKLVHVTRMRPKKEKELLDGGSIYWVFRGLILARQQILGFEEVIGSDKIKRCGLLLSEDVYRTSPQPKRAFQGWPQPSPIAGFQSVGHPFAEEQQHVRCLTYGCLLRQAFLLN